MNAPNAKVAIIDYGMGNLFSVKHACEKVGLSANITSSHQEIWSADAVILPGVGAFGDAMVELKRLDLVGLIREIAASSKPFMGICLGMHLMMSEGFEFGHHEGLNIIQGSVVRFEKAVDGSGRQLKVPEVQWNRICCADQEKWGSSVLHGLDDGEFMYFVHSYYVVPQDEKYILTRSRYGNLEFCSSMGHGSIFACQFHPERSGEKGLHIYNNFHKFIQAQKIKRSFL